MSKRIPLYLIKTTLLLTAIVVLLVNAIKIYANPPQIGILSSNQNQWDLIDSWDILKKWTTIGYIYSTKYLKTTLHLSFTATSKVVYGINGGILQSGGYKSINVVATKTFTVQKGTTAKIKYQVDYRYEYYEKMETGDKKEKWYAYNIRVLSGKLVKPAGKKVGKYDSTLSPMILSPGQTAKVTVTYLKGKTVTINPAVTLSGSWYVFSGSVRLAFKVTYVKSSGISAAYIFKNIDSSTHEWDIYRSGWILRPVLKN